MSRHAPGSDCTSCEEKLRQAHPYLGKWFHKMKSRHPDLHIAWSYRGKEDQEQAFAEGKTHAHYPNSPHNRVDADGDPLSYALDLFQLTENGLAQFFTPFYRGLWDECVADGDEIIWGGNFRSIGDFDHFEFNPEAKT